MHRNSEIVNNESINTIGEECARVYMSNKVREYSSYTLNQVEQLARNHLSETDVYLYFDATLLDKFNESFIRFCKVAILEYRAENRKRKNREELEPNVSRSKRARLIEEISPTPASMTESSEIKPYDAEVIELENDPQNQDLVVAEIVAESNQIPSTDIPQAAYENNSSLFFNSQPAPVMQNVIQPVQDFVPTLEMQQYFYMWQLNQFQQMQNAMQSMQNFDPMAMNSQFGMWQQQQMQQQMQAFTQFQYSPQ